MLTKTINRNDTKNNLKRKRIREQKYDAPILILEEKRAVQLNVTIIYFLFIIREWCMKRIGEIDEDSI